MYYCRLLYCKNMYYCRLLYCRIQIQFQISHKSICVTILSLTHIAQLTSSVNALKHHIINTVFPIASKYNLSVDTFGKQPIGDVANTSRKVAFRDAFGTELKLALVTPGLGHGPYNLLSGTIRNVLSDTTENIILKRQTC